MFNGIPLVADGKYRVVVRQSSEQYYRNYGRHVERTTQGLFVKETAKRLYFAQAGHVFSANKANVVLLERIDG